MAWTAADLEKIERAIADGAGVRSITMSDGQTAVFNMIDDMLKLRAVMMQEVSASSSPPRNIRYAVTSKGA